MRPRQPRGFTFRELLVAYALVGIAAFVIYSVYMIFNDPRHSPSCLSNLKQLSLAIYMYTLDYDDQIPLAVTSTGVGWARRCFSGYVGRDEVFHCPQDQELEQSVHIDQPNGFSYVANGEVLRPARARACSMAAIQNPGFTVWLTDRKHDAPVGWSFTARTFPGAVDPRHNSGVCWAFVDTHVKWIRLQKFAEGEADYTIVPALKEADEKDVTTGNDEGNEGGGRDAR